MSVPPVHLCGHRIDQARHVCAFFQSKEEEYNIIGPFVKEGLAQKERVVQIMNGATRADHDARMARHGVDVAKAEAGGQLSVLRWEDAYLQDGYFDQDRMLALLQGALKDRRERGFPLLRAMGNMDWALQGRPGTEQLLEYETRVSQISASHPDVFICLYDMNKFPASLVVDVLRTHPAAIIGGVYHENPFFVPPEQMLQELVARGKAKRA
ncbi:MAG TPA: MEDS domain-containing protein [Candidatus Thermoplasmatota archaeon]|nr:MEDS domain-containing protein [Candidatus Thermoplasmatota archaeon]